MPIGIGLGTAIAGVVAGGATAYAAHSAASSAKKAGEQQATASDKQLAFAKDQAAQDQANWEKSTQFNLDQYNAKEARLAPYRNIGTSATTTLANLIGGSNMADAVAQRPAPATFPFSSAATAAPAAGTATTPAATPTGGTTLNSLVRTPTTQMGTMATMATAPTTPTAPGVTGAMVTMRSPTGQVGQVPQEQVAHFQALGAQVVS